MTTIPPSHPRYLSLKTREQIAQGMKQGIVHETGLIAHGRGEAFDYLLGEATHPQAEAASKVAAAALLTAAHPVISVNGNVAALAADSCIHLAHSIPAHLEVNLFHRTLERMEKITALLQSKGAQTVYGLAADERIPGLDHDRALCEKNGIFSADVVLVPLEDGDRCQALCAMGKTVITIDLNPLSRTAQTATITIVDNVIRALPGLQQWVVALNDTPRSDLAQMLQSWDNTHNLKTMLSFLSKRLNSLG
ncbi:MAG: phosphopantothenate/pantothenate synthetase [Candidatus Thermoplasmatota archaeon]|nr:phosphopantothenate/pantothenate synthetase [Candidatus Thermoplasmatota archaeon]